MNDAINDEVLRIYAANGGVDDESQERERLQDRITELEAELAEKDEALERVTRERDWLLEQCASLEDTLDAELGYPCGHHEDHVRLIRAALDIELSKAVIPIEEEQ